MEHEVKYIIICPNCYGSDIQKVEHETDDIFKCKNCEEEFSLRVASYTRF